MEKSRPREIIEYCLMPLACDHESEAYQEAYRRLEHVIKTYQLEILKHDRPVVVDFARMPESLTINEAAHGMD
jgi:hypothetical protein